MGNIALSTVRGKRGRKPKNFRCPWDNVEIPGLYRRPSGRWRVTATGQEFTEPNAEEAVRRFRELTAPKATVAMSSESVNPSDPEQVRSLLRRLKGGGSSIRKTTDGLVELLTKVDESSYVARVRKDLVDRPQWLAQMTGFAQLAWLDDVKQPTASPALKDMVDGYVSKPGLSSNEQTRSRHFWKEFLRWSGATRLAEITHETVKRYETKVRDESLADKSIKHRFGKVKTIVAYALKRGADAVECRRALDVLAMLEMPKATGLDPHPISPKDFWKVYAAAIAAGDHIFATMMLTALNCCMYSGEVCDLEWSEVDLQTGEVVTRRPKTGVARVAVLWPETIKAIAALPRERDNLFFSERVGYSAQLVWKRWVRYATPLELTAHFSDIRDAAYTAACRSVSLDKAKILAGHRLSGATDHYVQRNPGFVKDACEAIHAAFFPMPKMPKVKAE